MRAILSLVFIVCCLSSTGQSKQDWVNLGDDAMTQNDPYGALRYYQKAFVQDSSKGTLIYRMAEAYRGVQNYPKAVYYYDKLYRRDRGVLYKDVGQKLAEMQMQAGDYKNAKITWRRVRKDNEDDPTGYAFLKAQQAMRSCDLAETKLNKQSEILVIPFDGKVNTADSELSGKWDSHGNFDFLGLRGEYDEEGRLVSNEYLIQGYQIDSEKDQILPMEEPMINNGQFGYVRHNPTRGELMVRVNEAGQKTIILRKDGQDWNQILPQFSEDSADYTHPAFGIYQGENAIYFSSNREDGYGQYDIWVLPEKADSSPINLGNDINTPGNEVTPFYREDSESLIFASDWHHGLGGFDLFRSDYFEGSFSFPENMLRPINSQYNDLYYSFESSIKKGSITSNRVVPDAFGGCCNDLYFFEEVEIEEMDTLPVISNLEELNEYLPVVLYFHNDEPDPRTLATTTRKTYLDSYRDYLKLLPDYRANYRKGLADSDGDQAEEAIDEFFIEKVDGGVADLELFSVLLLRELEEGSRIEITVKGFASPLAATEYNVNLTQRRIASLENHLRDYERGVFRKYLDETAENGSVLRISKIPFGEYVADSFVSDNPNESDAVYGIAAARERKIEIVSVSKLIEDTAYADVLFDSEIVDLGLISTDDTLSFSFSFEVLGSNEFEIDSVMVPNSIITSVEPIFSEGSHKIQGYLIGPNLPGKRNEQIVLFGNIPGDKKELNLTFEVGE